MLTVTGAWSRCPAASGLVSRMVICTVSWPDPPLGPGVGPGSVLSPCRAPADATGETELTIPGVVLTPSGSVTVTWSPALTRYSWLTGTSAITTGTGEVAVRTVAPGCGGDPRTGFTPVTRSGPGA